MAMIRWFGIASAVLWLAAFADGVSAVERRVPGDYPTIQAAIDAADPGDVIRLADGEYLENIDYRQKPVTVTSTRSPDRCIFTGAIIMDEITGGIAVLRGITFTGYCGQHGPHGPSDPPPCAFRIWRADAVVDNCRFVDNGYETLLYGAGLLCCIDSHAAFLDCVFNDNEKTFVWPNTYGMFGFIQSTVTMVRCEFNNNIDSNVIDVQESDFSMDNCTLNGNFSKNSGGAMSLNHTTLRLTRSVFTDNRTNQFGGAIHMEDMLGAVIGGSAGNGNTFTGNTAYRGNDLALLDQKEWRINTRYNQFSGMPNFHYILPMRKFDLHYSTFEHAGVSGDRYVSPAGSDQNNGLTPDRPLKTIARAVYDLAPLHGTAVTIHLAPGVYAPSTTGETFPVELFDYTVLAGDGSGETILDAEGSGSVLKMDKTGETMVRDLTVTGGYESGVVCLATSRPEFVNCRITRNAGKHGGGILCASESSPLFRNCRITDNTGDYGGGVCVENSSNALLTGCEIRSNRALAGGGVYASRAPLTCIDCLITGNAADEAGGGVYAYGDWIQLIRCRITDNSAIRGGGVRLYGGESQRITHCVISGNTVTKYGGGIACLEAFPALYNTLIYANSAGTGGGGLHVRDGGADVLNCTIAGNAAPDGGGVLCRNAFDAVFRNSIIYFNYPVGISMNGTAPEITFSDVQDGIPGTGNMNADPLFIDLPGADFRLAQYATGTPFQSPCVDGGDGPAADAVVTEFGNRSPLADFTTRRDDVPDSGVVDMGYHYPTGPADWVPAAEIHMQSYYVEGHVFDIHLRLYNPGAALEAVPVMFALEIDQAFYFWPHWMPAVEWLRLRIPSGITDLDLVKPMNWPVGWPAQNQPYRAWCAMLTDDMSAILGEMDMFEWWFGPEE